VYYFLPQLDQHAFNLEINPGTSNSTRSHLVDDIQRADIVVLAVQPLEQHRVVYPFERPGPPDAAKALEDSFCLKATVAYYRVYSRCHPRP
jgi:hypothetical protein